MKKLLTTIFLFLCLGMIAGAAQQVSLAWDRSCDISVTGYRIYQATNVSPRSTPSITGGFTNSCGNWEPLQTNFYNGNYTKTIDVGNTNSCIITNLIPGSTNMFMVTAYDISGLESDPSNELGFTVPYPMTNAVPTVPKDFVIIIAK